MNVFHAVARGMKLLGDLGVVAASLSANEKPDMSGLAEDLFAILTVDFKVAPHNATALKLEALLVDAAALFLP